MPVVEIRDLHKRFGNVEAVKGLSFEIEAGRVTGFLGPNGAGKSTTLRALLGLVRPTAGTATFGGRLYHQLDRPSAQVGAVLEDAAFHPGRTGRNHLRVLAAAGEHPEARVDEVLSTVGLSDAANRRVKGYSMGMRQRLGLAGTINTTFNEPADLARRLSGLDLLSEGRAGWNVVTTDNAWTGANFRRGGYLDRRRTSAGDA